MHGGVCSKANTTLGMNNDDPSSEIAPTGAGAILLMVLAVLTGPSLLMCWLLYYRSGCWALLVPLVIIVVLTLSGRARRLWRRRCIADCLFERGSLLHRLLYSSTWATVLSLAAALVLTAALMMDIPGWNSVVLAVFVLDAVLQAVLYLAIWHLVHRSVRVRPGPRMVLVRSWSVALNVLLMLSVLLAVQLKQPPPAYLETSPQLHEMLQAATAEIGSECQLIDTLVRFGRESEALGWWLTLRATRVTQGTLLAWLAWGLFLLGGSLSLWAYSAFCTELIHKAHLYRGDA